LNLEDTNQAGRAGGQPSPQARVIAFYLPQFHPTPENDRWWGAGFTEWTNVVRARPLFRGHHQPRIPADLGFYDLRVPESRIGQAELARGHGIEGFCYWHYWFSGQRFLGRPFEEVLHSGQPDFPFCLAWANEAWTRTWLGSGQVLQNQEYSPQDDRRHARWLVSAFSDPRYLRVSGRPIFLIYRPRDLPNARRTIDAIKDQGSRHGLAEPFLIGINADCSRDDCRALGFDGTLDFEPQLGDMPEYSVEGFTLSKLRRNLGRGIPSGRLKVYDYGDARRRMAARRERLGFPHYRSIMVGWDSTPRRRERAIILIDSTPERFESGLASIVDESMTRPYEDRLVMVNAWNEWAEGNCLEPDLRNGLAYLAALKRAVVRDGGGSRAARAPQGAALHVR
jgi:glycosyl transferase family WbsX